MSKISNFFSNNWAKIVSFACGVTLALLGKMDWLNVVSFLS